MASLEIDNLNPDCSVRPIAGTNSIRAHSITLRTNHEYRKKQSYDAPAHPPVWHFGLTGPGLWCRVTFKGGQDFEKGIWYGPSKAELSMPPHAETSFFVVRGKSQVTTDIVMVCIEPGKIKKGDES